MLGTQGATKTNRGSLGSEDMHIKEEICKQLNDDIRRSELTAIMELLKIGGSGERKGFAEG